MNPALLDVVGQRPAEVVEFIGQQEAVDDAHLCEFHDLGPEGIFGAVVGAVSDCAGRLRRRRRLIISILAHSAAILRSSSSRCVASAGFCFTAGRKRRSAMG